MTTVLITGGTGLIGTALTDALVNRGYDVIILSRKKEDSSRPHISYAEWDIAKLAIDREAIQRSDYIIHLAGANVGEKRWTARRKKEITGSRVKSGELLVKALTENTNHVKAVISASGVDWYTPDPVIPNPRPYSEQDAPDDSFLSDVCVQWEKAVDPVMALGKRLVILRTGVVYSEKGGAFKELEKPMRFGVAAILGNGRQVMSWIHIDDLVNLYIEAIENENWRGIYNAVAPQPASNKEITMELARSRNKIFVPFPVPAFLLITVLGEMSATVLKSCTVSAAKVTGCGYKFSYSSIKEALSNKRSSKGNGQA